MRKGQIRLDGFNDRIIALYGRGMTTRDIRALLREMYDLEASPDLISRVTDAVLEELQQWQSQASAAAGSLMGGAQSRRSPRADGRDKSSG